MTNIYKLERPMIEKIKDILYDLSDIAVSLLIIAVIFVSVSWKISDTLNINLADTLTKPSVEAESDIPVTVIIPDINTDYTPEASGDTETQTPDTETTSPDNTETSTPDTGTDNASTDTQAPTTPDTTPADTSAQTPVKLVSFEVPEGATGYSIGKKLVAEGYVDNVDTFVNRLVALKLDNKLRAGTFKLSKSDSLDTIIKVLAGQSR